MDIFIQQIINGLVLGSIYALVALGYTMVYGIMGLINFAHGEVVMIGAMVALFVIKALPGLPVFVTIPLALIVAASVCMAVGFAVDRQPGEAPITTLTGEFIDQAALSGALDTLCDLGMPLLLVECLGVRLQGLAHHHIQAQALVGLAHKALGPKNSCWPRCSCALSVICPAGAWS